MKQAIKIEKEIRWHSNSQENSEKMKINLSLAHREVGSLKQNKPLTKKNLCQLKKP